MSRNPEQPPIVLTTTTSRPTTHTTTVTTTLSGSNRRNNGNQSKFPSGGASSSSNAGNTLTVPGQDGLRSPSPDHLEPFPTMPTPSPAPLQQQGSHANEYNPFNRTLRPPIASRNSARTGAIGIRRLPSSSELRTVASNQEDGQRTPSFLGLSRPRSRSERKRAGTAPSSRPHSEITDFAPTADVSGLPGHYELGRQSTNAPLTPVVEGQRAPQEGQQHELSEHEGGSAPGTRRLSQRLRGASNAARSVMSRMSDDKDEQRRQSTQSQEYDSNMVDMLDVLDPEVAALTTLTNVQNSLFVPDLGRWLNRRPTYQLSRGPTRISERPTPALTPAVTRKEMPPTPGPPPVPPKDREDTEAALYQETDAERRGSTRLSRGYSITSHVDESHYAVLPHGATLAGWSEEDKEALDDHVRHMLHSRRSKFKQSMRAFGKYVRKPLGLFVTVYATLITLFGLAWVLFLIGWIYVGDRQSYIINIIDNVLVALFAIMGDGLAPFRCVDTYHMIYIAHYHRLTWKLRDKKALPSLPDHNDLPDRTEKELEEANVGMDNRTDKSSEQLNFDTDVSVLSPEQQRKLIHHQNKFSKSHSYYRPHETTTHHAFPLKLLIAIVSLLDAHSALQISLGACTWGISYHHRPAALTATILCCSITVNITAGILISIGDRRTRKKDVLERMTRQGLTEDAMRKVQREKREKEEEEERLQQEREAAELGLVGPSSTNSVSKMKDIITGRGKSLDLQRRKDRLDGGVTSGSESDRDNSPLVTPMETPTGLERIDETLANRSSYHTSTSKR